MEREFLERISKVRTEIKMLNKRLPSVTFKTRVRDENISETNPYRWQDVKTEDYFSGKRAILFSLPGAFTPICSTYQLPNYENLHSKLLNTR